VLAVTTWILNYTRKSPYRHLLPETSELLTDPLHFVGAWAQVIKLHEESKSERALERRLRHVDDVTKRKLFRKVHGMDKENQIANFLKMDYEEKKDFLKDVEVAEEGVEGNSVAGVEGKDGVGSVRSTPPPSQEALPLQGETTKRKAWFGLF
jgi:hypothetical protein